MIKMRRRKKMVEEKEMEEEAQIHPNEMMLTVLKTA